eukprot:3214134-Rhodomonas_salina.3
MSSSIPVTAPTTQTPSAPHYSFLSFVNRKVACHGRLDLSRGRSQASCSVPWAVTLPKHAFLYPLLVVHEAPCETPRPGTAVRARRFVSTAVLGQYCCTPVRSTVLVSLYALGQYRAGRREVSTCSAAESEAPGSMIALV